MNLGKRDITNILKIKSRTEIVEIAKITLKAQFLPAVYATIRSRFVVPIGKFSMKSTHNFKNFLDEHFVLNNLWLCEILTSEDEHFSLEEEL